MHDRAYGTVGEQQVIRTVKISCSAPTSTAHRSGALRVEGTTAVPTTNVTVNTSNAILYADYTFAGTNQDLANGTNTFTAVAKDSYGRVDTNVSISYLPSSISFSYDSNGNLTNDGRRSFSYDDENQLTSVQASVLTSYITTNARPLVKPYSASVIVSKVSEDWHMHFYGPPPGSDPATQAGHHTSRTACPATASLRRRGQVIRTVKPRNALNLL
jgi:hypothetical protein